MQPAQSHTGSKQLNQNSGWSAHLASKHIHFGPVTNMATLNLLWATEPPWIYIRKKLPDFPNGTVGKNPPANAGDMGLIPGLGRSHMP